MKSLDLNQDITFEKKDDVLGNYYIIYEEFLESLMSIPSIILLPLKLISLGLYKIVKLLPEYHWAEMKFSPFTGLYNSSMQNLRSHQVWINNNFGALNEENKYSNINFHFLPLFFRVISHFIFIMNYGFSYIAYLYMKHLSAGHCRNISVLAINNENGIFL